MFKKKPLKVGNLEWYLYTVDCSSVIDSILDSCFLYVFAFPMDQNSAERMGIYYDENSLWDFGYDYVSGFTKEEASANAID